MKNLPVACVRGKDEKEPAGCLMTAGRFFHAVTPC
jgi:hypothetical protein